MARKAKKEPDILYQKEDVILVESSSFVYDVYEYKVDSENKRFNLDKWSQKKEKELLPILEFYPDRHTFIKKSLFGAPKSYLKDEGYKLVE